MMSLYFNLKCHFGIFKLWLGVHVFGCVNDGLGAISKSKLPFVFFCLFVWLIVFKNSSVLQSFKLVFLWGKAVVAITRDTNWKRWKACKPWQAQCGRLSDSSLIITESYHSKTTSSGKSIFQTRSFTSCCETVISAVRCRLTLHAFSNWTISHIDMWIFKCETLSLIYTCPNNVVDSLNS